MQKINSGSSIFQAHVTSNLQTSKHLYQQLLQIQNRAMDDFDSFLENRMPVLPVGRATQQNPDDEMEIKKKTFLGCMAEISTELSLLRQQTDSLEEQNAARAEKRQKEEPLESQMVGMRRGPGSSTGSQEGSGKESIEDFVSMALHPDETLLNRYAAMIYTTTDNGRIYEEMAGASMCESCGEKTFLCPHKVGDTKVISLPKHCTHIKICRPQAHRLALAAKLEWLGDGLTPASSCIRSSGAFIPERAQITQKPLGDQLGQSAPSPSSWQGSWALEEINLSRLDKHFGEQMKVKREAPRMMSLDLCLSLAEQLLANVMYQEDGRPENPRVLSVQELLWELLTRRYVDEDISSLGLQDFLAAVWKYSTDNKVVCLLTRVLCGQLDQSVLRYVLLQAELLNLSPLTEPSHLLLFIEQHYPFLEETERDSLVLEFTAYSQRSISSACMMGFILHRILQNKEPLIMECSDRLLTHLKTQIGFLSSEELSRALGELASLSTKKQRDILIQQSASSLKSDLIPITHAAHILAYLTERGDAQKRNTRGHVAAVNNTLSTENRRHKGDESLKDFNDLCSLSNILNLVKSIKTVTGQAPQNMASFLKRK
ncbi:uncharacterized protein O3C94_018002 [Discoglossus pictus]